MNPMVRTRVEKSMMSINGVGYYALTHFVSLKGFTKRASA